MLDWAVIMAKQSGSVATRQGLGRVKLSKSRTFHMKFEPMTIEHLGLRLYSTLPPVLAELVSNAYDAESPAVEIVLPPDSITPASEVIVRDFGHGMSADELEDEFLPIGRNRRGPDSSNVKSKHGKRAVTGRKGLGKLSSFGIAKEMEIRSIQNGIAWTLVLDYHGMNKWARAHQGKPYEPKIVAERTGVTTDANGVEVILRGLRRRRPIDPDDVRRGLAQRLRFIGAKFQAKVNGRSIGPGDRTRRSDCKGLSWDVENTPAGGSLPTGERLGGWIGFVPHASQSGRGVDIFATGKAVQLGSFFNYSSTHAQFASAHLVGEVSADFLDAEQDLVSTARNSVLWEVSSTQLLRTWGRELLRWAFEKWLDARRVEKEETITKAAGFDRWIQSRLPREQRVAKRMLKMLVDDENLDSESARPLLEIIKTSVETAAFRDLIEALEAEQVGAATLLKLFEEWRVIEAREHLQLADGRRSAITQLERFIEQGALEVQELQPLLVQNLWLLDPAWTEVDVQPTYTNLLRKKLKEPPTVKPEDRRLDIIGVKQGSQHLTIVELKRPEKTLSRSDLEQIERYVDWAEANIGGGTGDDSPSQIDGRLIVGKMSKEVAVNRKVARLAAAGIKVETFRDLHTASHEQYKEIEKRLKKLAPEYTRTQRRVLGRKKR